MAMNGTNDDEFFEKDAGSIKAGIQIRNLRKVKFNLITRVANNCKSKCADNFIQTQSPVSFARPMFKI